MISYGAIYSCNSWFTKTLDETAHTYYHVPFTVRNQRYDKMALHFRQGVVARSCNPATWRPGFEDGLRQGVLVYGGLCRSGVRTKRGINMVTSGEPRVSRLSKEGRTGPGRKRSRQKSPCRTVVGQRLWIVTLCQPCQYSWTQSFLDRRRSNLLFPTNRYIF